MREYEPDRPQRPRRESRRPPRDSDDRRGRDEGPRSGEPSLRGGGTANQRPRGGDGGRGGGGGGDRGRGGGGGNGGRGGGGRGPRGGGGGRGGGRRGGGGGFSGGPGSEPCRPAGLDEIVHHTRSANGGGREAGNIHPGLFMDKLIDVVSDEQQKKELLLEVSEELGAWKEREASLNEALYRRRALVEALGGLAWEAQSVGPVALHLARSGLIENGGLAHHRLRAFPVLPGPGLKGLARRAALAAGAAERDVDRILGRGPSAPLVAPAAPGARAPSSTGGAVAFLDALPSEWPYVEVDVTTSHHKLYYEGEGAPGDWEDPSPAYFLSIAPGSKFSFGVVPSGRCEAGDLEAASAWLNAGMRDLGAGAKTAVSYGRFSTPGVGPDVTHDIRLVSPAFLAGASQGKADCRLRASSLKGHLRWWWRALHLGLLPMDILRRVESSLFGGIHGDGPEASAIDLVLVEREPPRVEKALLKKGAFLEARHVSLAQKGRVQGIAYLAYGMSERGRERFVAEGGAWTLELRARAVKIEAGPTLSEQDVMAQATAALAFFDAFGGIGARSRKGFGSLDILGLPTLQQAKASAEALRRRLGSRPPTDGSEGALAHTDAQFRSFSLEAPTSWVALERIGLALSALAADHKHESAKRILGLPRKIHGPKETPLDHQSMASHESPQKLAGRGPARRRHASPVLHHLSNDGGVDRWSLKVAFFRAPLLLEEAHASTRLLAEYLGYLQSQGWRLLLDGEVT